jgi:tetratricopeptide (TPR) repeat protein
MCLGTVMRKIKSVGLIAVLAWAPLFAMPITGQAQQGEDPVQLTKKANELRSVGKYAEAIPYARRALVIEERRSGANHPNVEILVNNLALLYLNQGRYADAEPLYKRSLAIREQTVGPNHPDVANSLNNLAELYLNQVRYADAEPSYKQSLAIREQTVGPNHPDVANSLNNLAGLYRSQGRYNVSGAPPPPCPTRAELQDAN